MSDNSHYTFMLSQEQPPTTPGLLRRRLESYAPTIVDLAERALARLDDGAAAGEVARVVARLTLAVAAKIVFDTNIDCEADQVGAALAGGGRHRRARAQLVQLEQLLQQRLAARRAAGVDLGDLLSAMIAAGMSDARIRVEVLALLTHDRERATRALVWSVPRLARQPARPGAVQIAALFDEALRHGGDERCHGGDERCHGLGEAFVRLQGQLILATLARRNRPT